MIILAMTNTKTMLAFTAGFSLALLFLSHQSFIISDLQLDPYQYVAGSVLDEISPHSYQNKLVRSKDHPSGNITITTSQQVMKSNIHQSIYQRDTSRRIPPNNENIETSQEINSNKHKTMFPQDHACAMFGESIPAAISVWNDNLSFIFNASRGIPTKPVDDRLDDFTALLLHFMTPERLLSSVKALPSQKWDRVGEIMEVLRKRLDWELAGRPKRQNTPRQVRILIVGGSVTMGIGCEKNPVISKNGIGPGACAWPSRLRRLLAQYLNGYQAIDLRGMVIGGSNTATATNMWEYSVFPQNVLYPDIVINAYATNDMHVLSEIQAKKLGITLEDMIMRENEKFVRTILSSRPPKTRAGRNCQAKMPLLLYFDDYIGNEQRGIVETMSFSKAISSLSSYYSLGIMSYADAVRDLVYANTTAEEWFSASNWPERNVHPGMGMHISSAWIVAFNLLNLATTYCSLPSTQEILGDQGRVLSSDNNDNNNPYGYKAVKGLPKLRGENKIKGGPSSRPLNLLPELTNLTLDNISMKWKEGGVERAHRKGLPKCVNQSKLYFDKPCVYSWISHLPSNPTTAKHIENKLAPVLKMTEGWKGNDDHHKAGYVASKPNAAFVLELANLEKSVKSLIFFVMTSYGKKWEGSMIHVDSFVIKSGSQEIKEIKTYPSGSMDIVGYHERNTSETLSHKVELGNGTDGEWAKVGDTLRVEVQLVGGRTFKIMGMLFCDH